MYFSKLIRPVPLALGLITSATTLTAHEAWLLTPAEIEALATAPVPALFTSVVSLGIAAVLGGAVTIAAIMAEDLYKPYEAKLDTPLQDVAATLCPLLLRLCMAVMLGLAGTGGLPRHGTAPWAEPTLFVPDMQLSLLPGWDPLAIVQIGFAILLFAGLFTRAIGLGVIVLSGIGLAIFGMKFVAYAPHFAAPGLLLWLMGSGKYSADQIIGWDAVLAPGHKAQRVIWRTAQVLIGGGFVYLAVAYKLTQPTLLIAILEHGNMPTFGVSIALIALIMTGVEVICGALLVAGRLIRPVSLAIIGAISFLAITLGETPLFHANLYGVMITFALVGRYWPARVGAPTPIRGWAV